MNPVLTHPVPAVAALQRLHHRLASLPSLRPSPQTNAIFESLVALAQTESEDLVDGRETARYVPAIRRLAGSGEAELEHHWAARIGVATDPGAELIRFPYYRNYHELAGFELDVLAEASGQPPRRLLFIGGGPLPMTGIMLARLSGSPVDVMDVDPLAADAARTLLTRLDLGRSVRVMTADAATFDRYGDYDAVILAALVGDDAVSKTDISQRIISGLAPGAVLAARSATGNRRLLYPPVPMTALDGLAVSGEYDPPPGVINSVVVGRKPDPSPVHIPIPNHRSAS